MIKNIFLMTDRQIVRGRHPGPGRQLVGTVPGTKKKRDYVTI